jgi:hypothetical protein
MGRSSGADVFYKSAVIANGGTASAEVDLGEFLLVGVSTPTLTGTALSFTVATATGGTFKALEKDDGNAYSLTVESNKYYPVNPDHFRGVRFLKAVSGSAEGAERTLTLHLIPRQ